MALIEACCGQGRSAACVEAGRIRWSTEKNLVRPEDLCTDDNPSKDSRGRDRHVILVQQRLIELQAMAGMLHVLGYQVTMAADSARALLYFGRKPCNLVVSELDMPGLNGFHLAGYMRKHAPQTRILLMTARCQAEVADYMDAQVVDGWLFKPFRMDELKDMLISIYGSDRYGSDRRTDERFRILRQRPGTIGGKMAP